MNAPAPNSTNTATTAPTPRAFTADVLPAPAEVRTYSASEYAALLGTSRQAISKQLRGVAADRKMTAGKGRAISSWPIAALPQPLLDQMLAAGGEPALESRKHIAARCPIPADCAEEEIQLAEMRRRALKPFLARWNKIDPLDPLAREGVNFHAGIFGQTITRRWWTELFLRAVDLDGGLRQWDNLAIYLPKNPRLKGTAAPVLSAANERDFAELHQLRARFRNAAVTSIEEIGALWLRTFEIFHTRAKAAGNAKKFKRRLLNFLWKHYGQTVAISANALRVSFDRKYAAWLEKGAKALADGRRKKKGELRAAPFPQDDVAKIGFHAGYNCEGRSAQAIIELSQAGELTAQTERHLGQSENKSYVNKRLLDAVRAPAFIARKYRTGEEDDLRPKLTVSYEGEYSMKKVEADDFTMNVKCRIPDGCGWWTLTRGQFVLVIDYRTTCILGNCSDTEEQPNSLMSRTAFEQVYLQHGLPAEMHLERGRVFADSKLLTGGPRGRAIIRKADAAFSDAEVEFGLAQHGIKIIEAQNPESKPIERVGGLLQDMMAGLKGSTGRDEQRDCPAETLHWEKELKRRKPEALAHFYTWEEWEAVFWELCQRYNKTVHGNKTLRIPGLSPIQAFQRYWPYDNPPARHTPEISALLAHHRIDNVRVTEDGIAFTIRGVRYRYFGEEVANRYRSLVTAWFNPDLPEACVFTGKRGMVDAFALALHVPSPMGEPGFDVGMAMARAQAGAASRRFRVLKAAQWQTFRDNLRAPVTEEFCRQLDANTRKIKEEKSKASTRARTIQSNARKLQMPVAAFDDSDQTAAGLALMAEAKREHRAIETTRKPNEHPLCRARFSAI